MKPQESAAPNVAVYWDFENIHASLHEREIGPYRTDARFRVQPPLVDIGAIMDYASTIGNVCVNRAYCNWSYFHRYQDALSGYGISLVQMFPRGQHGKNGADVQMCVDMVEDLLRLNLEIYIIVSGDSDYIGVAQKVRQYGKRVIGIGVRDYTNRYFQRVCDEFKFYESLVQQEREEVVALDESGKMTPAVAKKLLVTAVNRLAIQSGGSSVVKAQIKPMMLRLEPAFDERSIGYANFSAFLSDCTDVIEERVGQADHMISVRTEGASATVQESSLSADVLASAAKVLVAAMTFLISVRSTVPLPELKKMLIRLQPDFDERKIGVKSFSAFLQQFPHLVGIQGENEFRHVVLLVPPDPSGFKNPMEGVTPAVPVMIPEEMLRVAVNFHVEELRGQLAVTWADYYERLRAKLEKAGLPVEDAHLKAIRKVFLRASVFQMLPDRGGIAIRDEFVSEEAMNAALQAAEQTKGSPGGSEKSQ